MATYLTKLFCRAGVKLMIVTVACTVAIAGAIYISRLYQEEGIQDLLPPKVEYLEVQPQSVQLWQNFSGRLVAVERAEIKSQIGGEIQQVNFVDAQLVEKGDLLFVIDPRLFQAEIQRIEAQLVSARSREKLARDELVRAERLVKKKLVSDSVHDAAKNEYAVAKATISELKSALAQARINLDYCYIKAPFSGRMSRAELTVGNVVETMPGAPVLTTIVAEEQLYAEFDVDEQTYIRIVREQARLEDMPVRMTLTEDDGVVYRGHIHAFDNQFDASSGTIRARALFDNTDGVLIPGMFVSVKLGQTHRQQAFLLPEKAIGTNQSQKFVLLVDESNMVQYRPVEVGETVGQHRIIRSGLQAGDHVIINGLSHTRPNMPVNPVAVSVAQ